MARSTGTARTRRGPGVRDEPGAQSTPKSSAPHAGGVPRYLRARTSAPVSGEHAERDADRRADAALAARTSAASAAREHTAAMPGGSSAPAELRRRIESIGTPLPHSQRATLEGGFGADFSRVRIATDPAAAELAASLGARAITHGETIAFAPGEFAPGSAAGDRLLAHELAHVVQQRSAGVARIALQGKSRTLLDEAWGLVAKIAAAASAAERKPLVVEALQFADRLATALTAAKAPSPPSGALSADDVRSGFNIIGRQLVSSDEMDAAVQVARKSQDTEVQQAIVNTMRGYASGVGGQQRLMQHLAKLAGERIAGPTAQQGTGAWLDANTGAIGKTFSKLDQMGLQGLKGGSLALDLSHDLIEGMFTKSSADVKPEKSGKVAGLATDATSKKIEADCDVYATYAAGLLRAQGWTTAGYMAIFPDEKKPDKPGEDRDGHAVALMRRAGPNKSIEYLGTSNTELRKLGSFADDAGAKPELHNLAHEVYSPALRAYRAYYLAAAPGGALDIRLLDPKKNNLTPYTSAP